MAQQDLPLMPKATAVWLVDNTTLTFRQIADFVGMHELEISGIADGEVAVGIKGFDPIVNNQLTGSSEGFLAEFAFVRPFSGVCPLMIPFPLNPVKGHLTIGALMRFDPGVDDLVLF